MTTSYAVGEKALCYHGPMIYECKILRKTDAQDPHPYTGEVGPHYYVHYKGWKASWDEWVPTSRILKYSEDNLRMQKEMQMNHRRQSNASKVTKNEGDGRGRSKKDGTTGTRGTKRSREEADGSKAPDLKFDIPNILKLVLVDDWEAVTKSNQLLTLPRKPNVQDLLETFRDYVLKLEKPMTHVSVLPHIIAGLTTYFDRSLGQNLLYRFERPQYASIRKQYITGPHVPSGTEKEMSTVYGAEHFLRMIVSLPAMVASSTMDPDSVAILSEYVTELLNFMVLVKDEIFLTQYEDTDPSYQNISRA